VDLRANPATKPFAEEKHLQANLQRLEALDRLSLYFCLPSLGDSTIEGVPVNDQSDERDWELRRESGDVVTLAPYPFRREPLSVSILARRVPKRHYAEDVEFQKVLSAAQYSPIRFTLKRGKPSMQSLLAGA
jgi:hypothetical protein